MKNPDLTVAQYLSQTIGSVGENMAIVRFSRLVLGETAKKEADAGAMN